MAIQSGDYVNNIRRYVLGAGCKKGVKDGIDTLDNIEANATSLGQFEAYREEIKKHSSIRVDMMHPSNTIVIETQGGEPIVALGFRGSLFFAFWS